MYSDSNVYHNTTSDFNTSSATQGNAGRTKVQNIFPVCIKQLMERTDEDFSVFGMKPQMVVIVGILRNYDVQSTKVTYEIEDHTGTISAIYWIETDTKTAPTLPAVKEGRYVQVFASVRNHDSKRMLMILKMFQVDRLAIIDSHLLQVILARLEAEAMSKNEGNLRPLNHPGLELANSMTLMDTSTNNEMNLNQMQQKVYNILRTGRGKNGMSRTEVMNHFQPYEHQAVNNALDFLGTEGHAYTTVDSDHFMATDSI